MDEEHEEARESGFFYWMKFKGYYYEENKRKSRNQGIYILKKKDKEMQFKKLEEIRKKEGRKKKAMVKECSSCRNYFDQE